LHRLEPTSAPAFFDRVGVVTFENTSNAQTLPNFDSIFAGELSQKGEMSAVVGGLVAFSILEFRAHSCDSANEPRQIRTERLSVCIS
jgi:hypothetical protein